MVPCESWKPWGYKAYKSSKYTTVQRAWAFQSFRFLTCSFYWMWQVIKDFASGEIKQASSLFNCDITLEEYLIKSYYKTASLVAASTKGAAIFSGVGTPVCEKMYEYGKNLGLSFQVVDDILDFTQSAEQLGKPAASDLANGNLTAPVIFALEKEPKLRDIIDSEFNEPGSLDEAIELVLRGGGIERAHDLAREKANLAIQNLQCLPQSEFRLSLEKMATYNLERIKWTRVRILNFFSKLDIPLICYTIIGHEAIACAKTWNRPLQEETLREYY